MSYSILSDQTRQQLEQERDRLTHERDSIIQAAVAHATSEVSRALEHVSALLEGSSGAVESVVESNGSSAAPEPELEESAPSDKSTKSTSKKGAKASKKRGRSFDAQALKSEFEQLLPVEAMRQVMLEAPDHAFLTDEVIERIYDEFNEADLPRARKSVAGTLARGVRQGLFEKISNNPTRFKVISDASESDAA